MCPRTTNELAAEIPRRAPPNLDTTLHRSKACWHLLKTRLRSVETAKPAEPHRFDRGTSDIAGG